MESTASATPVGDLLSGGLEFVKLGPIGLAGLMLVLVIVALFIRNPSAGQQRLLMRFMMVGAFCFVVACIAAFLPDFLHGTHTLSLSVQPLDAATSKDFPPPRVTAEGNELPLPVRYQIGKDVTLIVDVSAAVKHAGDLVRDNEAKTSVLQGLQDSLNSSKSDWLKVQFAVEDARCSSGPLVTGPTWYGAPDLSHQITTKLIAPLDDYQKQIDAALKGTFDPSLFKKFNFDGGASSQEIEVNMLPPPMDMSASSVAPAGG